MPSLSTRVQAIIVITLLAIITVMHYLVDTQAGLWHLALRELYFLPIILASFWFGLAGGLGVSLLITLIYGPFVWLNWGLEATHSVGNLLQLLLFNLAGGGLGWLRERDQRRQAELCRTGCLAATGQAAAGIAHDLKSPLIAIGGFAMQVKRELPPNSRAAEKLEIVLKQTARLEGMVKNMLTFAKPLQLETIPSDLNHLVEETAAMMEPTARGLGVELHTVLEPELGRTNLDHDRMQQALINLLANALEASPQGGVVTLSTSRENGCFNLKVSDSGEGVPPGQRETIWEPFVSNKKGGTGLGLANTKKIVEAHGGAVGVSASAAGGACFCISLPAGASQQIAGPLHS